MSSAFLKTVHQNSCKLWVGAGFQRARPYGWYYCNSAQFMTSTSDKRNETHPHGGRCPLTRTTDQNIGGCVWRARGADALRTELALRVQSFSVLTLRRRREQFCVRSQELLLHSVPKGWAETGKKLVRTSAVSLPSTQQKRLRHGGDGAVGGFESRYRRTNLLTHVGTSCLFLSVCLWLLSPGIKHIVIGLSRAVWKIRRMKHLFGTSWCTLRAGLNMVSFTGESWQRNHQLQAFIQQQFNPESQHSRAAAAVWVLWWAKQSYFIQTHFNVCSIDSLSGGAHLFKRIIISTVKNRSFIFMDHLEQCLIYFFF